MKSCMKVGTLWTVRKNYRDQIHRFALSHTKMVKTTNFPVNKRWATIHYTEGKCWRVFLTVHTVWIFSLGALILDTCSNPSYALEQEHKNINFIQFTHCQKFFNKAVRSKLLSSTLNIHCQVDILHTGKLINFLVFAALQLSSNTLYLFRKTTLSSASPQP